MPTDTEKVAAAQKQQRKARQLAEIDSQSQTLINAGKGTMNRIL